MASTVQNQEVNQDDLIMQQQRSIEKEVRGSTIDGCHCRFNIPIQLGFSLLSFLCASS